MSLSSGTFANKTRELYAPAGESAKYWYKFPAANGQIIMQDASGSQILQAIGTDLFYDGQLLAKASDIETLDHWSEYPVINPAGVNFNGNPLVNATTISASGDINGGALTVTGDISGSVISVSGVVASGTIQGNSLSVASLTKPFVPNNIQTDTLSASGAITSGSLATTGAISGTTITGSAIQGTSLITTGGLDMTNTAINRASSVNISNSGFAPYGQLTSPNGVQLLWNGSTVNTGAAGDVSQWSNFNAVSDINGGTHNLTNIGSITTTGDVGVGGNVNTTGYVRTNPANPLGVVTNQVASFAGSTSTSLSLSGYRGIDVVAANNDITTTATAGSITHSAYNAITETAGTAFNVTVDRQLNPAATANINLTAQNGGGGVVDIIANPALLTPVPGVINITANGGNIILPTDPPTTVTVGGVVNISANTGGGGLYTLTSAVKIGAAGVNSYAGAIPSVGSLAGYNFIYGTAGVNLCAGLPSSGFQFPGTIYQYAVGSPLYGGIRLESPFGVQMLSDTYIHNLYPLDSGGLVIQGRSLPTGYVTIKDVDSFVMKPSSILQADVISSVLSSGVVFADTIRAQGVNGINATVIKPPLATGVGNPNLTLSGNAFAGNQNYVEIQNADVIAFDAGGAGSLTGVKLINGLPYVASDTEAWATYKAIQIVDLSSNGITACGPISGVTTINGSAYPPPVADVSLWATYKAVQSVDLSSNNINNVAAINTLDGFALTSAGSVGIFADTSSGNISIATNGGGNVNIGTGNAGDINILTSGAGNDLNLGGDTVTVSANVGLQVNADTTIGSVGSPLALSVYGNINATETITATTAVQTPQVYSGADILLQGQNDVNVTTVAGAVNITGFSEIRMTAPHIYGVGPYTGTSVSATGDVISSSATTPYSLNVVGGLVNSNQQYNYWVAVNGSDVTGTGSAIRPFASITAALANTVSISDTIPVNICITAGTYTESPTVGRNNTFLVGSVGVADAVIIGTLTFNTSSATTVSQGMSGITVVGNVVCSENTSADVSWYIQNCNVTSYGASAINCSSTGTGNNNLVLQNTVVTQNTTASAAITMATSRLNLIQAQVNNTTTGPAISCSGASSLSCFGATFTCAGSATASAIVSFNNTVVNGTASSFNVCTFTYTAGTAGSGKTAVFFNNSAALAGLTTFNNNVFNISGSTNLILRPGAGSVAIQWGANSSNVLTLPAAGAGLTYTYLPSTPLRANSLYDAASSAGTGSQVLTAGSVGGSLNWSSLGASSLGALGAEPAATAYQNQLVFYNTATQALSYGAADYQVQVTAIPATIALATTQRGRIFILTSTGAQTVTFTTATLTANDVGFFVKLKNGNANGGGDITISGATGNLTIHNNTATATMGFAILYWTGSALVAY